VVDPAHTVSRIYLYFYLLINVGSLAGSIATVYAERFIGFWLSYLLPTIIFAACPLILILSKKKYVLAPPTGSVIAKAWKLVRLVFKGRWSWNSFTLYDASL
jgi:POT family proton-dependent oligopeptide transporter